MYNLQTRITLTSSQDTQDLDSKCHDIATSLQNTQLLQEAVRLLLGVDVSVSVDLSFSSEEILPEDSPSEETYISMKDLIGSDIEHYARFKP
tara:strand:- start:1346 stop:1621 length:276 start_codon:yes stop_codon:yes gene_type:complete